jgi:hypothetical protein
LLEAYPAYSSAATAMPPMTPKISIGKATPSKVVVL